VNPKVSVCIPTYNCCKWLLEAIDSVLDQSFRDYELIIVDDGSTDDTEDAVKAIKDERIRYYYKENGGDASARNFGVARAYGDLVAFLDSDDLWPKNYLSVMVNALEQATDYSLAYSTITKINLDGKKKEPHKIKNCASGWLTRELFLDDFIYTQATILRKSVLKGIYCDESLKTSSDFDVIIRLSEKTKFLFVSKVEVIKRDRENNTSSHYFSWNASCNKIRALERFYRMNGEKYFSKKEATHRISQAYRKAAKRYYYFGARKASIYLYKQALSYNPFNIKGHKGLIKALMKNRVHDKIPDWRMPPQLPEV